MTKRINETISNYVLKHIDDQEKITDLAKFIEAFFVDLGDDFEDIKEIFAESLDDYTYEITEEELEKAASMLLHKDGSASGIKWSHDEIDSVIKQYNIKDKFVELKCNFCPLYFWFAMNYVYATHYNVNRNVNGYIELAIDELCNKNICFDNILKNISKHL